jgi:hypothetical protein
MPRIEWTTAGHAMDGDTPRIESIKKWSEGRSETERRGIQKWTKGGMRKRVLEAGLERTLGGS